VLHANFLTGFNSYYIGYNFDMAEQFIADCAEWAETIGAIAQQIPFEQGAIDSYIDEEGILNYRLRFPNGRQIVALSSKPANLRSKKGRIVVDEAAFHSDVEELLKAAMAITIWGGQLRIISTHDGEDNPFNDLVKQSRNGDKPYSLHRITFEDAIAQGLYKRIAAVNGEEWTLESEFEWERKIRELYGVGASEELDVIPAKVGKGLVFAEPWFSAVESVDQTKTPRFREVRFWDLAATERDVTSKKPCYTSGVKIRRVGDLYYVMDVIKLQLGPADIDDAIQAAAEIDGVACSIRWEQEGGSAGKRDAAHIARLLNKYDAQGVLPRGDKVTRARPWASQLKAGNARLLKADWNKEYIDDHVKFPEGDKDSIDASSGAYDFLASSNMSAGDFYAPGAADRAMTPQARLSLLKRRGGSSAGLGTHMKRY
jgi:predicted phage terminase large subunit-like protein